MPIHYEVSDLVATITIDRPEKRNAMTFALLREFTDAVRRAGDDPAARVVVITGTGGSFCAGTDLSDLEQTPNEDRLSVERPSVWPIVACPKPVVAAVDGAAAGMGADFATQCDVRIASSRAHFAWLFVRRGLVADTGAGTYLLPRLIGPTAALRLLYSGEFISASEALDLGFVSQVVPPEELADAAEAEARRFLAGSPMAIARTKQLVYSGLAASVEDHLARTATALAECFRSQDHREGVAAFMERRDPNFTGQ